MSDRDSALDALQLAMDYVEKGELRPAATRVSEAVSHIRASDASVLKLEQYQEEVQKAAASVTTTNQEVADARHAIQSIIDQL